MSRRVAAVATIASTFGLLALPGAATADTQVIGSALQLPYQGGISTGDTTTLQQTQVGGLAPNPLTSPGNGVITEWKVRTSDDGARYTLRVLSPSATANSYVASGSAVSPLAVPPGTDDAILTYPGNSLAIKQSDHIGLLQTEDSDEGVAQNTTNGITTNVIANLFTGDPLNGVPTAFLPDQQHELLLQATVKFCKVPNVTGLKANAATAALAAADCGAKVSKKGTGKKKNVGKVLKQGQPAGFTAAPGTEIPIVVGKKQKKKKGKKKKKK